MGRVYSYFPTARFNPEQGTRFSRAHGPNMNKKDIKKSTNPLDNSEENTLEAWANLILLKDKDGKVEKI
jgi:hypothetical protein